MELTKKLREASICKLLRIDQLILNQEYSVGRVVELTSGYGGSVIFILRNISDFSSKLYKGYLLIQYADVISDTDIEEINKEKIWLHLVYRGISRDSTSILEIT
jgi:hypothetical protein